jgi:carbon-monoxide dehydrogenase large subunit
MSEGIGVSVRRKEDKKFLTGKGRYTDDISRPGQVHAFFVRSDVAHANIKSINIKSAKEAEGVVAVYTGDDVAADGIGGPICGWVVPCRDGSATKEPPHPILAQ